MASWVISDDTRTQRKERSTARRLRVRRAAGILAFALAATAAGSAAALDLPTLDKISVMMSMDQVRYVAGAPDEMSRVAPDLALATWRMTDTPGMVAAGGIFDGRSALIAQAYVFAGETGAQALASLKSFGFKVVDGADGVTRLYGPDDDTGRPLVVIIDERPDTTTVFAYEQKNTGSVSRRDRCPPGPERRWPSRRRRTRPRLRAE